MGEFIILAVFIILIIVIIPQLLDKYSEHFFYKYTYFICKRFSFVYF